jgi:DNA ligase (NAD+)
LVDARGAVGPQVAASVYQWFRERERRRLVDKLRRAGVRLEEPRTSRPRRGAFAGKTVVLTGTLASLTREEATEALEAAGARVASTVSNKTDLVVVGADPGTKYERALALGVPTLDERELRARLRAR